MKRKTRRKAALKNNFTPTESMADAEYSEEFTGRASSIRDLAKESDIKKR